MNLDHFLSHVTAMIRARHPSPVRYEPQRLCRALLGIDDGRTEVGQLFELGVDGETSWGWRTLRTAPIVIRLVQMGNVPMVLRTVSVQGIAVLSGYALTVRYDDAKVGDMVELSVRALDGGPNVRQF